MPRTANPATALLSAISKMQADRAAHVKAIEQIDLTFAQLGITPTGTAGKKRGRPAGVKASTKAKTGGRKRGRGSFSETAEEFVLNLLKGGKSLTTKEINVAWKQAGRGGSSDNTLTKLAKAGALKRTKIKDGRGSKYQTA